MDEAQFDKKQDEWHLGIPIVTQGSAQAPVSYSDIPNSPGTAPMGQAVDPYLFGAQTAPITQAMRPGVQAAAQLGTQTAQGSLQQGVGALGDQYAGMNKILLRYVAGQTILTSTMAALFSIPNSIIGKQVNAWASENGIDVGNLRLMAFEQMYTMPVEDPKTGQWTYLFDDETQLRKRMAEAGVPKDLIDNRVIQMHQLRAANAETIATAGPLEQLRATGQIQPGELPFSAAQRIVQEKIKAQQAAFDYANKPVNSEGKTQQQIDTTNKRFAAAQMGYASSDEGQIFTSNFNAPQPMPRGANAMLTETPQQPTQPAQPEPQPTVPTQTFIPQSPATNQATPQQQLQANAQGMVWDPFTKTWRRVR